MIHTYTLLKATWLFLIVVPFFFMCAGTEYRDEHMVTWTVVVFFGMGMFGLVLGLISAYMHGFPV